MTASESDKTTALTADAPAPSLAALYATPSSTAASGFRPPKPPGRKYKCVSSCSRVSVPSRRG